MAANAVMIRDVLAQLDLIAEPARSAIVRFVKIHRALIFFFLLSYLAVACSMLARRHLMSETMVGVIFLSGAVFVYIGWAIGSPVIKEDQEIGIVHGTICVKVLPVTPGWSGTGIVGGFFHRKCIVICNIDDTV